MTLADLDLSTLTTADRLALIERLWEALDEREVPVTPEERDLLDARLADLDADVAACRPAGLAWEDVRARWATERRR
jgi:putative addiction module component (TIGR02574 family)